MASWLEIPPGHCRTRDTAPRWRNCHVPYRVMRMARRRLRPQADRAGPVGRHGQLARPWQTMPAGATPRGLGAAVSLRAVERFARGPLGEDPSRRGGRRPAAAAERRRTTSRPPAARQFAARAGAGRGPRPCICRTSGCRAMRPRRGSASANATGASGRPALDAAAAAVILQDYLDGVLRGRARPRGAAT